MRVYADFMARVDSPSGAPFEAVRLNCAGTVFDLCRAQARLHDGLALTLFSDSGDGEDLEADATVRWVASPVGGRSGFWVGEFDPGRLRHVPSTRRVDNDADVPCLACGRLTKLSVQNVLDERCLRCGARALDVLAPSDK